MFIQAIVYSILSILAVTAVYAASMPISKGSREEQLTPDEDQDNHATL
ncbi:MAG: hypothetical protein H6988_07835 [Pseudomonadales bacterium]|nr:hypothetical protein [Halieaceae bacterium]MCP5190290.1 hypothetical protein [Pseudomonadales bacterium]